MGSSIRVSVTCVEHPFSFYVVLPHGTKPIFFDIRNSLSQKSNTSISLSDYKSLFDEMKSYYSKPEQSENLNVFPAIGSLVAVIDKDQTYRARVIDSNLDENQCFVQCIDTGTSSLVERRNVFTLKMQFALLPALALQCSLANIEPIERDDHFRWSREAM